MKLSIFCCLSDNKQPNQVTIEALEKMVSYNLEHQNKISLPKEKVDKKISYKESGNNAEISYEVQVILNISRVTENTEWYNHVITRIGNSSVSVLTDKTPYESEQEAYNEMADKADGDYFTVMKSGDTISENLFDVLMKGYATSYDMPVYMINKEFSDETMGAFRTFAPLLDVDEVLVVKEKYVIDLNSKYDCYPYGLSGNFIKLSYLKEKKLQTELGLECERDFMLRLMAEEMKTCYLTGATLYSYEYEEHSDALYKGLYMKEWYFDSITSFWIPFLNEMKDKYGRIPVFIQYNFMYTIRSRFEGNLDNKNKHVIEEGHGEEYLELIGSAMQLIEENIMFNRNKVFDCIVTDTMKWIYGILRNGPDFKFHRFYLAGRIYYGIGDTLFNGVRNLGTQLAFIDYVDGRLEIDGSIHPILYSMAKDIYFKYDGKKYPIEYNETYNLTKVFGVAVCKRHSFHLTLPVKNKAKTELICEASFGGQVEYVSFKAQSHFSRVTDAFGSAHWNFGDKKQYMMCIEKRSLAIYKVKTKQKLIKEIKLFKDLIFKDEGSRKYAPLRLLYFICKPFMTRKPIWMYIDKIYKGGDSSEYLYKYAKSQKSNIKHYYLIDKESTDYKRLKAEGYKPLVRDSLKHRLIFLYADMMVISNSTVYAFNGYKIPDSACIRDLPHFHVCCVQHGMSVQKIAVAQNRLRDNIRLYFCASKYEIENLEKPIYGYEGYDALKLTGVPRYDGLVDRAEKQIMISPTWRMQAAMPVITSEGEQRDYNPLFKESEYYKVYNSLINDDRLINAAKEYGYKIKYVLHPIVSSQVDDFDKNDYVDIVPAVGDMSYEDMFCESSLMVTDYSGIQFDFAYMRKPLLYLHHKDIPQHYEEGTFHYDTMAFGEICHDNDELIDKLIEYMKNGCRMKPEYVKRADDFFYYSDHNNCERIYNEMIEYQNKHNVRA